jgi:hypothetical protein
MMGEGLIPVGSLPENKNANWRKDHETVIDLLWPSLDGDGGSRPGYRSLNRGFSTEEST